MLSGRGTSGEGEHFLFFKTDIDALNIRTHESYWFVSRDGSKQARLCSSSSQVSLCKAFFYLQRGPYQFVGSRGAHDYVGKRFIYSDRVTDYKKDHRFEKGIASMGRR